MDPQDRPDPTEQPLRARVPEHVTGGAFSTGVIVMTAQSEFILDFVQNLGRPHQIVARVVMPHHVLPQLVDALQRNIELYKSRWGELPHAAAAGTNAPPGQAPLSPTTAPPSAAQNVSPVSPSQDASSSASGSGGAQGSGGGQSAPEQGTNESAALNAGPAGNSGEPISQPANSPGMPSPGAGTRQASAQEIYDDLKIKDELLSGAYANAVMIGHGPHEFSFDFITNFYPHSAVSARVFLASGQVPRLYDSLKGTWDQLRLRAQPRGGISGGRPVPPNAPGTDNTEPQAGKDNQDPPAPSGENDSPDHGPVA